jgi:hypothetical protein
LRIVLLYKRTIAEGVAFCPGSVSFCHERS